MPGVHDYTVDDIGGKPVRLKQYDGDVLLIVNVASACGFTPQYKGLEEMYEKFSDKGLVVLGFPCDQFGHQEPGDEAEIKNFCSLTYDVKFPMFAKVDVNGAGTHPLYKFLKHEAKGLLGSESIKWNFTKFLIDKNGNVVKRYAPTDTPTSIAKDVAPML